MSWIGVDLDGTLARYDGWKGPEYIGEPIPAIVTLVKTLLSQEKEVRIFTARASKKSYIPYIEKWCQEHIGTILPVTNQKDFDMEMCIDDRCIQVQVNTGKLMTTIRYDEGRE